MPYSKATSCFNTNNTVFAPWFDMKRVGKFLSKSQNPLTLQGGAELMLKDKLSQARPETWGVCHATVMRWCKYIHDNGGHLQNCRKADIEGTETVELQSLYQSRAAIRQLRGKSGSDPAANLAVAQEKLATSQGLREQSRYQASGLDTDSNARAAADAICQHLAANPFRVDLKLATGAHAIGMYRSSSTQMLYILDPNHGLRAYKQEDQFKQDLVELFTTPYGTCGKVGRVELFEVSANSASAAGSARATP
jgi:hypothetical protein